MCGRYSIAKSGDGIAARVRVRPLAFTPRYNVAPSQEAPVIFIDQEPAMKLLRWGLVPSWAGDQAMGARLINAKAETLLDKPAFRNAFARQRCLVLADGYYEWKKRLRAAKRPYRFALRDESPFAFAGLWEKWKRPDESVLFSFTIITTEPNELARQIHDRMPVILHPDNYEQWLDPTFKSTALLGKALQPFPASEMTSYPVDPIMNSPNVDEPRCMTPSRDEGFLPGFGER